MISLPSQEIDTLSPVGQLSSCVATTSASGNTALINRVAASRSWYPPSQFSQKARSKVTGDSEETMRPVRTLELLMGTVGSVSETAPSNTVESISQSRNGLATPTLRVL